MIPQNDPQTYVTEWKYDTWNRLTSMTYADGEIVDYTYNVGGLLLSMSGKKKGNTFSYVKQLGYDKFEQRSFLWYGNGTKTTYNYEPDRRRLKNMTAKTQANRLFMDNTYTYDKVNNILNLKNNAPIPSTNLMGGASEYNYSYDDLYRLTSATGSYKGANDDESYTLAMSYNSVGGITQKTQSHLKKAQVQKKTTYDLAYVYGSEQPHAPAHIGDNTYAYDANGNQTGWKDDKTSQRRQIMWDEENRIRAIEDNGAFYHYAYDASGERVWKGKSTGQSVFVNGELKAGNGSLGNFIVYVNPYLVLKSGGYTKHYYIEGQRIVSKLGGGFDNNTPNQAGNGKVDYNNIHRKVFDGIVKNLKFLGADGQILTAGKSGKIPPGQVTGTGNISEAFRYFYHPDHLGSTSYVTDATGEVYQHLEYFAFGETFVEEHSNTDRTPYLFNGKELDEETGLYYYGARYYDAKTSVWQSVDPMSENFSNWSPYSYVYNNPLIFVDPTGAFTEYYNENGQLVYDDGINNGEMRLIEQETFEQLYYGTDVDTESGKQLLRGSSREIKIDNNQIQSDLQKARDLTRANGVEYSVEIILRPDRALVTSRLGEVGDNGSVDINSVDDAGSVFEEQGAFPLLGQAHGHPLTNNPNMVNEPSTSDNDKNTAISIKGPIYAIDSYSGKVGKSGNIHRVEPNGTRTDYIGLTSGDGSKKNAGQFNLGADALRISGKARKWNP